MALQRCFSKTAHEVKIINENLSVVNKDDRLYFFNGSGPIYCCGTDDKAGIRLAEGMFVTLQIARPTELARALGVDQSTVHRNRKKYQDKGVGLLGTSKSSVKLIKLLKTSVYKPNSYLTAVTVSLIRQKR